METQEHEQYGTNAEKTNSSNSGKQGILKKQSGDENIPNLEENKELLTREKVEGTPFEIIGNDEIGYWAGMGAFRISERKDKKEEVEKEIEDRDWEMIINVMCGIMASRDMELIKQSKTKQF